MRKDVSELEAIEQVYGWDEKELTQHAGVRTSWGRKTGGLARASGNDEVNGTLSGP